MFGSLLKLADDVLTIATTPVKIGVDVVRAVTKPIADVAKDAAKGVEELTKDEGDGG